MKTLEIVGLAFAAILIGGTVAVWHRLCGRPEVARSVWTDAKGYAADPELHDAD